jgi:DNA-binding NarL/FixJ family response regulator
MAKTSKSPKNVFIVEDHPVFREGLVQILGMEPGLKVCGEAGDAEAALRDIPRLKPDLVLVDITLPGKSGLDLIKELRAVDRGIKILAVSMHDEALYADRVLRAGGDGYIMKQEDPEEIVRAIQDVLAGRIYVSEAVMAAASKALPARPAGQAQARPLELMADRELEILHLLGKGKTHAEIARHLGLSPRAVAQSCAGMQKKLDLKNLNELIRYAVCWVETAA